MALQSGMRAWLMALPYNRLGPRTVFHLVSTIQEVRNVSTIKTPAETATDSFGTIELRVEEKALFHDYDQLPEDQDAQDVHEAKIADVFRPGRADYLNRLNHLIHDKNDLKAALQVTQVPGLLKFPDTDLTMSPCQSKLNE